ncbi:MAG: SDR family oxidoreductase [Alphaproteobacteria bacterium]|nr:SDR family oxidoreductase [Alphaproteobacteria bacterium]
MSIDLGGKVVIVTGGGRGLGRAMTLALAGAGARVVAAMHIASDIEKLAADAVGLPGKVHGLTADVRRAEDATRIVRETLAVFGALHVVVNNAGVGMLLISETYNRVPVKFWEIEPAPWREIIETNVNGPFHMARAAVPHMLAAGWGRIVNVTTSITTMQRAGYSPYGSSKAALEAQSASWAGDLEGTSVTVNILVPGGAADTNLLPGAVGDKSRSGADGNLLDPAVMRAPIRWLASDLSNGVNGRRFIGRLWDDTLPPAEAAKKCGAPIGFDPKKA